MELWRRARAVLRGRAMDQELDEEMASHVEMATEENRRRGMSEAEARRAALAALGGLAAARETHREARGIPLMETLWQDLRYALRTLRRDVGLAAFAILITGLGVGASVTVFSVVHAILLRDLPVADGERLLWIANTGGDGLSARTTQTAYLKDMQGNLSTLAEAGGYFAFYGIGDLKMTGAGEPERLTGVPVTGNFFSLLGVVPVLGTGFTEAETQPNGPDAVMVSHDFWERRMHRDAGAAGRTLLLNERPCRVAGVLPKTFDFGAMFAPGVRVDVFPVFPLSDQSNRWGNTMSVVGRLKPGATAAEAAAEMKVFARQLAKQYPGQNDFTPQVRPLREYVSGSVRTAMLVLSGAVGLVLLIVCANLSNLLLARATARQKEISIRVALGAGRWRIMRQMLVESLLLAALGAALGLALAAAGTRVLAGLETEIPMMALAQLDWQAMGFAMTAAVVTGIGFGLAPAVRMSAVTGSDRGASATRQHTRVRNALVVAEVALASLLLVGSGLLIRSFARVLDVTLGFQPRQAAAVRIDPGRDFPNREARHAYYRAALDAARALPGMEAVGLTDTLPLGKNRTWGAAAKGQVYGPGNFPLAYVRVVSDGFFESMGMTLVQGRTFTANDDKSGLPAIVVNETLARRLWPGEDPLGKVILRAGAPERVVVGVVKDVRHLALEKEAGGEMYLPIWQTGDFSQVDLVTRGGSEALVRNALRGLDPALPLTAFRPLQTLVDTAVSPRRLIALLLGGFATFALLLASLGIYGVISYSVTQRRKEMGIRMALGATGAALQQGILWQTLRLAGAGLGVGLLAAWALTRVLQGMLFGVTPSDPATFGAAMALLTGVALLAGYLPARRAARLNPVETLRLE